MKKTLLFLLLWLFSCNADTNYLMPDFRVQATPIVNDCFGTSMMVESGRRTLRLNGTLGVLYHWDERLKISAEFLQQKLQFSFSDSKKTKTVQQYALGVSYQQDFCYTCLKTGEIKGYISYAPNKSLSSENFLDRIKSKRIDGSTAYGGEVNFSLTPWQCASMTFGLDYDGVVFHRRFISRSYIAGFGGSIAFCQNLSEKTLLHLTAEFRRPFNYFEVGVKWLPFPALSCGIFGSFTDGKAHLPEVAVAGIELNYAFPVSNCVKECGSQIASWVSTPAVYLPEVFAIREERTCHFPVSLPIPSFVITTTGFYAITVAPYFLNVDDETMVFTAVGLPAGSSINPATGVISGLNPADGNIYQVTVTATKSCASSSQSFTITYL